MRLLFKLFSVATLFAALGCGSAEHVSPGPQASTNKTFGSFNDLNTNIFTPKCASCHSGSSPAGNVDLSSYAAILSHSGLIVKGNPSASLVYTEVQSGDMPDSAPPLSAGEVQAIADWINAGAPNGSFAGITPAPSIPTIPAPSPAPLPPAEPTFTQVQAQIFNAACVRCHSGAKPDGKVDLTTYKLIMGKSGLIVAGDAAKSLIYTEIIRGKMPPRGTPVSATDQNLLRDWINAGAKNN